MIDLKEGEVICSKCNGKGVMKFTEQHKNNFYIKRGTCDKCQGEGKLDWVENIVGKKEKNEGYWDNPSKFRVWKMENLYGPYRFKNSSQEIKEQVDKNYRKKLERSIAYNRG